MTVGLVAMTVGRVAVGARVRDSMMGWPPLSGSQLESAKLE